MLDQLVLQYVNPNHMWQSWVEIEHYSVAYFDRTLLRFVAELPLRARLIHAV